MLTQYELVLFENQIQTTSASPYRTQVQPTASFLVCSLIFIEYKKEKERKLIPFFDLLYHYHSNYTSSNHPQVRKESY